MVYNWLPYAKISIHALLAESDFSNYGRIYNVSIISIHALLAESDRTNLDKFHKDLTFLSTLSLRRATRNAEAVSKYMIFLSTLSLRRATGFFYVPLTIRLYFYPRSPCGERQPSLYQLYDTYAFLSTLSLRRATWVEGDRFFYYAFLSTLSLRRATRGAANCYLDNIDFYPRSPCGERLSSRWSETAKTSFLSTLSLRRATEHLLII